MAMPRSEHPRQPPPRAWLADAGEVAQWTAQLLAWLWLGEQGQRLGWPLASGVWAVAVWWAVRVLCRGTGWAFRSPSALLGALGTVVALSGADPAVFGEGASLHATLLGQSLLSAVLGLCAGIPVLVLQAGQVHLIYTRNRETIAHRRWQLCAAS